MEKIYLGLILIFFIIAFGVRNVKTYLSTKQSIKGKSVKLTISILISTLIYFLILFRIMILKPEWILELNYSNVKMIKYIGLIVVTTGFTIGILALIAMRNSWRVGIKYDQKPDLVISGIYRFSRNPYFLSYDVLIFGYIIIFPSIILIVLLISLAIIFHYMILDEEKYLLSIHGDNYLDYKKRVNRYITIK